MMLGVELILVNNDCEIKDLGFQFWHNPIPYYIQSL